MPFHVLAQVIKHDVNWNKVRVIVVTNWQIEVLDVDVKSEITQAPQVHAIVKADYAGVNSVTMVSNGDPILLLVTENF